VIALRAGTAAVPQIEDTLMIDRLMRLHVRNHFFIPKKQPSWFTPRPCASLGAAVVHGVIDGDAGVVHGISTSHAPATMPATTRFPKLGSSFRDVPKLPNPVRGRKDRDGLLTAGIDNRALRANNSPRETDATDARSQRHFL